jgi:KN motif
MLPFGYQIDLDFIKYIENLSQPDQNDVELQRRQRRRQRQSMEVMLGIQLEMQNQMDQMSEIWERKPPEPPPRTHLHLPIETPIVPHMMRHRRQSDLTSWDRSLNDVVDDFEKTLERSKKSKDKTNRSRAREDDEAGECC